MARWEPDPRGRLLHAALELFAAQGYEATTSAQLAQRAGLTKATVFRLFADKREILFQGQDASVQTVRRAVAGADPDASPPAVVRSVLRALADAHVPEQREIGRVIDRILATSPDLRERAALKRSSISAALEQSLVTRGADPAVAGACADLGVRAYYAGFAEWTLDETGSSSLARLVVERFDELLVALAPVVADAVPTDRTG